MLAANRLIDPPSPFINGAMMDDDEVPQLIDEQQAIALAAALIQTAATPTHAPTHVTDDALASSAAAAAAGSPVAVAPSSGYVRDPNAPPVPLTILTGWLGAGKTTLLTRTSMLAAATQTRACNDQRCSCVLVALAFV